jgi:hypothetical protein
MESVIFCVMVLSLIVNLVSLVCLLMVGSVVVQMLDVLSKLPEEMRATKPREKTNSGDRPWWTHL